MSSPLELDLPQSSGPGSAGQVPSETANGTASKAADLLGDLSSSAKTSMNSAANSEPVQSAKDTIVNGSYHPSSPVGQTVQNEAAATSSEFKDLKDARQTPSEPAATGQPLTHYHSMFYRLLSWKSPRATGITFLTTVLFIFAARYLHVISYIFKGLYLVLGISAAAEIAGQTVLGGGLSTKMRPKKYITIPKESLERFLDDAEQLINFFVIEAQRILFAENIWVTVGAFVASFFSYWMIKWLPMWGLALIFDNILFLSPLIYIKNKEFIDENILHAKKIASEQASQVRDMAVQHTGRATESLKGYTSEYTKKAQDLIGTAKAKTTGGNVHAADFPIAPKEEPVAKANEPEPVPAA